MKWNNLFFYSNNFERDNTKLELVELMEKAGFISQETTGIYSMLSLGVILEDKISEIISREMESIGLTKIRMNVMQDGSLWEKTNRVEAYGEELFNVKNRKGKNFYLASTAEETVTALYKKYYNRQYANFSVFQIGLKFRDELRARAGLIRGKEFLMKDAYCFNSSSVELDLQYDKIRESYKKILSNLNLNYKIEVTDGAEIGGKFSEEFLVESEYGEDGWLEVAHIFKLGDNYSRKLDLVDNNNNYIFMGCFGIGVSRLLMVLLEKRRDELGFWGDEFLSSVDLIISALDYSKDTTVKLFVDNFYELCKSKNISVLLDDRNASAGKKFSDSELVATRQRVIVSKKAILNNSFEFLNRKEQKKFFLNDDELKKFGFLK